MNTDCLEPHFFYPDSVEGALNHSGKCGFGEPINWFCMDRRPIRLKGKMYGFKNSRISVNRALQL